MGTTLRRRLTRWEPWLIAYIVAHLPRLFLGPIGIDLTIYRRCAEAASVGHPAAAYTPEYGFLYSPLVLMLMVPLAWVGPRVGFVILGFLNWASLYGIFHLAIPRLGLARWRPIVVVVLTLATVERYVIHTVNLGQVNVLLVLLLLRALIDALEGRRWRASASYMLATSFKLTPLVFVPYLLWRRQRLVVAASAVGLIAFNIAAGAMLAGPRGLGLLEEYVRRLRDLSATVHPLNVSLLAITAHSVWFRHASLVLLAVAFAFFHVFMSRRARISPQAGNVGEFLPHVVWWAWLMVFILLASPVTWFAHLALLLLPAMIVSRAMIQTRCPIGVYALYGLVVFHCWGWADMLFKQQFALAGYTTFTIINGLMLVLVSLLAFRLPNMR